MTVLIDFSRNMMWQHKTAWWWRHQKFASRPFFTFPQEAAFLHKCYSRALLCRRVSNRGFAGIIKGIGTAQSLSLVYGAIQPERSVNAGKTGSGFCLISLALLEAAMGSHIKRSILTVHIEVLPCIMLDYALQHKVISISSSWMSEVWLKLTEWDHPM